MHQTGQIYRPLFLSLQNCRISACRAFSAHNKPAVCPNPESIPEQIRQCFHYTIFPEDFQVKFCRIRKSGFPAQRRGVPFRHSGGRTAAGESFFCIRIFTWQNQESVVYLVVRSFPQIFCGCGEIGRHDRFRFYCSGVQVQVLSSAPEQNAQKWRSCVVSERFFFCACCCDRCVSWCARYSGGICVFPNQSRDAEMPVVCHFSQKTIDKPNQKCYNKNR